MSALALSSIYSQFFSEQSVVSTRYDSHKKDELKSIYDQIVRQSEDSPVYLTDRTGASQLYAIGLKEGARSLKNSISSLSSDYSSSILDKKVASSSDTDVVKAEYVGSNNSENGLSSFEISVQQLASPQLNIGAFLPNGSSCGLKPDLYSFDVFINDADYEFQFSVADNDTNEVVANRISRLINRSSIGLNASVISGEGTCAVRLESSATGIRSDGNMNFRISDVDSSKARGAVKYFGLDSVAHEPTNAIFTINGTERTAKSNSFTVQRSFELTLTGVSADESPPVQIGLKPDLDALTENINHLAGAYNDFIRRASEYTENYGKSDKIMQEMGRLTRPYTRALDAVGLNMQKDGTLAIDDDLLKSTAKESDPKKSLSAIQQFTDALMSETKRISLDPMQYTNRKIIAYKKPGNNYPNPYISSMYTGMLFSGFC